MIWSEWCGHISSFWVGWISKTVHRLKKYCPIRNSDCLIWFGKFWSRVLSQPEFTDLNRNYTGKISFSQNLLIKKPVLIGLDLSQFVLNSQNQLIYFASQKRHDQKNYKLPQVFAKLSLKTIWLNIPRYKSFKLNYVMIFRMGTQMYVIFVNISKEKKPEIIHPLTVMGKIYWYCRF